MDKIDSNALFQEFTALKREVERLRDEADIRQLQYRYDR